MMMKKKMASKGVAVVDRPHRVVVPAGEQAVDYGVDVGGKQLLTARVLRFTVVERVPVVLVGIEEDLAHMLPALRRVCSSQEAYPPKVPWPVLTHRVF